MKKGFTLIELLIVIVIVGILVTVALPKYKAALERGRAQEAISNLKTASDLINSHYVLDGNQYVRASTWDSTKNAFVTDSFTKPRFFSAPVWQENCGEGVSGQCIAVTRNGNEYVLTARSVKGELREISCVNNATDVNLCLNIGMDCDENDANCKLDFTSF